MNHVSVSPTDGNVPTQGQRKTLTRVGIEPTTFGLDLRRSTDSCVGPFPSVGLTLTWFIWERNRALHITLYSVRSIIVFLILGLESSAALVFLCPLIIIIIIALFPIYFSYSSNVTTNVISL